VQPDIYFPDDHGIDESWIDPDAIYILKKLYSAGYKAYLVGGSVRDLLVKKVPKDFDISTSAKPEEIKALFSRQCILIGKRFRLAHIRFGRKYIEVSTFRTGENDSGLILRDNEWGTPDEDVLRRDFTINGLFYDPTQHCIIDYVGGWDDIKNGILRTIGEPTIRFKQDPVRLLRLLKFQARFGFKIEERTNQGAKETKEEILKSSSARILEEFFRMLESGAAAPFIKLLERYEILELLMQPLAQALKTPHGKMIYRYLSCADQWRVRKGNIVLDRAVLTACLIFPLLEYEIHHQYLNRDQVPHFGEITLIASTLIKSVLLRSFAHFPKRITGLVTHIMMSQYRLTPLTGKRHYREKLFHHKDFKHTLKFLKLRALVDERLVETYISIKNQYKQFIHHTERESETHPPHTHTRQAPFYRRRTPHAPPS